MTDMILGAVLGECATADAIRGFVQTADQVGCREAITLISPDMSPGIGDLLGIRVLKTLQPDLTQQLICAQRWSLYRSVLHLHKPDRVILTDVRDVVFQSNPFEAWPFDDHPTGTGLAFFCEFRDTIGKCQVHRKWVSTHYDLATYARISNSPIVCAGVVLGSGAKMLELAELMVAALAPKLRECGIDQGVLNTLIWDKQSDVRLPPFVVFGSDDGIVQHLCRMKYRDLLLDSAGRVLNRTQHVVPILHQYDRIQELAVRYPPTAREWISATSQLGLKTQPVTRRRLSM